MAGQRRSRSRPKRPSMTSANEIQRSDASRSERMDDQIPRKEGRSVARLILAGGAIVLAVALLVALYSSQLLVASMRQLGESEKLLSLSDQAAATSIDNKLQRQEEVFLLLARYAITRREWSYLLHEFDISLTEFLEDQRYRQILPFHVARARFNHAHVKFLRGENRGALEALKKSIALADSLGDRGLAGRAKNSLGCVNTTLGNYQSASAVFDESHRDLVDLAGQQTALATTLRNRGLVKRKLGHDGTRDVRDAIGIMEQSGNGKPLGMEHELLQDFRMTLCEMCWAQGKFDEAIELSQQTLDDLRKSLSEIDRSGLGKTVVARNRYVKAIRCAERNLCALTEARVKAEEHGGPEMLGQTVVSWQWQRLCDLTTELVSNDLEMAGNYVAEFEQQDGLVMAWGMYGWSHSTIVEIAKNVFDRTQVVIFADNGDSLEEAQVALKRAGVPLDAIQFRVEDCENPWFRDPGPIVAKTSNGVPIWFDSRLTRPGIHARTVLDTLPKLLQRDWNARVADLPIHIEGGMILSNGRGVVVASKAIMTLNRAYGFTDEEIIRQLRRSTGAKQVILVDPLIGEPTNHIDLFMTFVNPTTVVVAESMNRNGPNASNLDRTAEKLSQIVIGGEPINVVRLSMPEQGQNRFPSYTNVVFANGVLLVPSYGGAAKGLEDDVRSTYQKMLPNWKVQFIDCSQLLDRGGALHCLVSNLGNTKFTPALLPKVKRQESI